MQSAMQAAAVRGCCQQSHVGEGMYGIFIGSKWLSFLRKIAAFVGQV